MPPIRMIFFVAAAGLPILHAQISKLTPPAADWPTYNRDLAATRYSPLTQINSGNVAKMAQAWSYHLQDRGNLEVTPIVVKGVMYLPSGDHVVALEPETGKEIWRYEIGGPSLSRGAAYWPGDRNNPPRILFTAGPNLIALNAGTGKLAPGDFRLRLAVVSMLSSPCLTATDSHDTNHQTGHFREGFRMNRKIGILAAALSALSAVPAMAHHSFSAEYDANKPVEVKGVVAKVEWVNPHAYIYVDVKDANGKVLRYAFETSSPNALLRRGWKRSALKEGESVSVEGYLAKDPRPLSDGSIHGNARLVTMSDGKTVFAGTSSDDGGPAK